MNSSTIIAIIIIIIVLIPAVRGCIKHFKGEGDCCGGPKEKVPHKKIKGQKLYDYVATVEGMHCDNCKNRIERHLNELDGVVGKVNRATKTAVASCYKEVDMELIKKTIEDLDFTVTNIEKR